MKKSIKLPSLEVRQEALEQLIASGLEPSAENLLLANQEEGAPLYDYFTNTTQREWAEFGQYQAARTIIAKTPCTFVIGGKTIETRYVEVIRDADGEKRYAAMRDILADPSMRDAYMAEIANLMHQAQTKMERLRSLMSDDIEEAA